MKPLNMDILFGKKSLFWHRKVTKLLPLYLVSNDRNTSFSDCVKNTTQRQDQGEQATEDLQSSEKLL